MHFFDRALHDIGLRPDRVAMIGDDVVTDIAGAHMMGMKSILVKTGKYRKDSENVSGDKTHIYYRFYCTFN